MNIIYNDEKKLFHLNNKKMSYMFFINGMGYLQHLYFGKKINSFDFASFTDYGYEWGKTYLDEYDNENVFPDNYYSDRSLTEIGAHGCNDKRGAQFIIKHSDGSNKTSFKYVSHRIYNGKPALKSMPHTFCDENKCLTLEIILLDEKQAIELKTSYTIFEGLDIIVRNNVLVNKSDLTVQIKRAFSYQLDFVENAFDLIHFCGDWSQERYFDRKKITDGKFIVQSNYGRSSHEENPFVILCDEKCDEQNGNAYAFSFVYSGNFSFSVNVDKWHSTRVLMGINDEDFEYSLEGGAEFEVPEGIIAFSNDGFGSISRNMHDLVRNNLNKHPSPLAYRPVLFNSWEGCYMDFDTNVILDYIKSASDIGAELFVLDDGWFGKRNDDLRALGDWFVNEEKIDLKRVIDECHKYNMKFGLWFEPEMINPNSDLYRQYPNYALGKQKSVRSLSRHQLVLDTSLDAAVDAVYDMMCSILDKYEIDYIKVDHNRGISEIESNSNYGETYHRLILGAYRLYGKLIERYPNLFIENCASGGGRFDLGMLYYSPQIWASDETNPVQRMFIQYGTSFGYPLCSMGSHISKCPITNYTTKGNIALFGTYGLEMNPCKLNEEERKEILKTNELYHKYHNKVIQNGDLYRLLSPFETNYMSMISVSKDKQTAMVLFANLLKENNRYRYLKLAGLEANTKYKNTFDNKVYTGDYYMNIGLNFTRWLDEFSSFVIILEAVE